MVARAFRLHRLPPECRRKVPLLLRACRLALGPRSRKAGELSLIFVTDAQIRAINRRFLGHDRATDVIAFPYPGDPGYAFGGRRPRENPPYGDVYVSVDRARKQAAELGHTLLEELVTLAAHGVLHLRGYDDHTPADRRRMFARQKAVADQVLGVR